MKDLLDQHTLASTSGSWVRTRASRTGKAYKGGGNNPKEVKMGGERGRSKAEEVRWR